MSRYRIIDQNLDEWDGAPKTLAPSQGVTMPKTPVGQLVLAMLNQSKEPNEAQLSITSGGSEPEFIRLDALQNAPSLHIDDYDGNNVNVTNVSQSAPIWISLYAPGFGNPQVLEPDGMYRPLGIYQSYMFRSNPNFMRLVLSAPGNYSVFVIYEGSTPKSYAVNAPDEGSFPAQDYDVVTKSNEALLVNNWNGKTLYVVNLSPIPPVSPQISLTNL